MKSNLLCRLKIKHENQVSIICWLRGDVVIGNVSQVLKVPRCNFNSCFVHF